MNPADWLDAGACAPAQVGPAGGKRVKSMEDYIRVRRMHFEEGFSVRAIARKRGLHRKTVQKMIIQGVPPGYR